MIRDTRPDCPPEFDEPTEADFPDADRIDAIEAVYGVAPFPDCLRAIDRHGDGETVSVRTCDGQTYYVPDDLPKLRQLDPSTPVAAWIVHGIAWDGSDWEYDEEVATAIEIGRAVQRFYEALDEHRSMTE